MRPLGRICAIAAALSAARAAEARVAPPAPLEPCLACHGENGQSQTASVPSLGGQPSKYLVIQLFMFREGMRSAEPMNTMTKGWSDALLQQAADYFAALPPPTPPAEKADPTRRERAAALTAQYHCNVCHTADFSGQDNVPRLADQREDYLLKALRDFKSGARPGYDATMAEALQPVANDELAGLAYYLAHFRAAPSR